MPGPHGFAVLISAVRLRAIRQLTGLVDPPCHPLTSPDAAASTASRPASVTIAIRPSSGTRRFGYAADLGQPRRELFLQMGLDRPFRKTRSDLPAGQNQYDPAQCRPGERRDPYAAASLFGKWLTASAPTNDGGYGSPLSRGRQNSRFNFQTAGFRHDSAFPRRDAPELCRKRSP